jgi:hypothetical protein
MQRLPFATVQGNQSWSRLGARRMGQRLQVLALGMKKFAP